ncbi:MAG: phosphoglycerate dehydrogenase [Alphaproteobacteria bacterium]|nr:phosphoglycerate dehydrogenase [Alphaproteobacteria bacterium]
MAKVLISDKMNPLAAEIFKEKGVEVDVITGLSAEELLKIIPEYDGLAVRSSTKVTPEILDAAKKLKVIGRAGIGVDNIDVATATKKGVVVMNTPFGNSITTAEHAIAMMFSLAREIPQANASTHAGKWEKSKFMGVELTGKTLGVIGCGNIGAIAAARGLGLKMRVIAFDPFLTPERAKELGVEKVELEELYARADFITIHVPKNEHTLHMINADALAKMKDGVRIINCARGGIIVEEDLKAALESGKVAGAALDVFEKEPAEDNVLFGLDNVICTPHLGASTTEAQVNVAVQVAEQMGDFLVDGAVTNALNMAPISAEDAPKLTPYLTLAAQLGAFAGQISENAITKVEVEYQGHVTNLNTRPISDTLFAAILKTFRSEINIVNVRNMLKDMKVSVIESATDECEEFLTAIELTIYTEQNTRSVTGTLFAGKEPRIVDIEGVPIEAPITDHMLFIRNEDSPGLIGGIGTILADADINIADFRLGRKNGGGQAVALIAIDGMLSDDVYQKVKALPQVRLAKSLSFV